MSFAFSFNLSPYKMGLLHKGIVQLLDVFFEPGVEGCFIVELMRGGSVHDMMKISGALSEHDARVGMPSTLLLVPGL